MLTIFEYDFGIFIVPQEDAATFKEKMIKEYGTEFEESVVNTAVFINEDLEWRTL